MQLLNYYISYTYICHLIYKIIIFITISKSFPNIYLKIYLAIIIWFFMIKYVN